jgi:tetratricopeptide (TPR) repeat protein
MTTLSRNVARLPRVPLAVLLVTITVVTAGQVLPRIAPAARTPLTVPQVAKPDPGVGTGADPARGDRSSGSAFDALAQAGAAVTTEDLTRIHADVAFWGDRFARSPRDFISATRLAASEIELARATGDITSYLAADAAVDGALKAYPDYALALDYRGVVEVALHRFANARDNAEAILADTPDDLTARATLGDASLELGDVRAAQDAFGTLIAADDSAAVRVRVSHLAFIEGRTADAVAASHSAVGAAIDEGSGGSALGWYQYQLGDTLINTGHRVGAAAAYAAALAADPRSHLAYWGLGRVAAADGRLDEAIADVSHAIAIVPLPEFVARRADLYRLRGGEGDARHEADDRKTVLAIAELAGAASNVYDRTLAIYLAGSGADPARSLSLAQGEIAVRKDVYGYDALAWALLANDRPAEADKAMTTALGFGTRDAKLLYHAGMIKVALGDAGRARELLSAALTLDPSFDPLAASLARTAMADLP